MIHITPEQAKAVLISKFDSSPIGFWASVVEGKSIHFWPADGQAQVSATAICGTRSFYSSLLRNKLDGPICGGCEDILQRRASGEIVGSRKPLKLRGERITATYLKWRKDRFHPNIRKGERDYPKWIRFCEILLGRGYELWLSESETTHSKYITVKRKDKSFQVRFSDHLPPKSKENDFDLLVGIFMDVESAIGEVLRYFGD